MPECTHLDAVELLELPDEVEGCEECLAHLRDSPPPVEAHWMPGGEPIEIAPTP